ncbi:hypothetical protein BC962_2776 [Gillisia mitskevichiae]|uniref:Anti-sigma factor n=1 Tax=Gillisia mitskevichiae TaxID=270921 RepID=A0A495P362_9FLAO|nr:hypothetical protein [Gillisia mitskevichiae]RKS45101.1 hypothetical protein BC962_2776 [Gillisia mitskevichiae]
MAQDIRNMFKDNEPWTIEKLSKGHQNRFEAKLEAALPIQKNKAKFNFLKIAAIFIVAIGIGAFFLHKDRIIKTETPIVITPESENDKNELPVKEFQLSEVSPDFKKIENYYLAGINMELAKLEVNPTNKALIDSFMGKMSELNNEYKRLNAEFNETGPNEQTIEAMVENLQFRLDLLYKLKNKLNEIKQTKKPRNENYKV